MDGEDSPSSSGTPRKSLLRSASWTACSDPSSTPIPTHCPNHNRPPKPGRLALPPPAPLAAWPCPASDDCGFWPATPSASAANSPASSSQIRTAVKDDISRVDEHVYLGGDAAAGDRGALRRHGITHVLNCAGAACPDHFRDELEYRTLWLRDSPAEDLAPVLYDAFDFLERARAAPRGRALVHCRRGASRSAALVIAYLMWRRALHFDEALQAVRAARPSADPNLGFAAQLLGCQRRVLALPPTPSSAALRAYRMAPQSSYDPLYLVPKLVDLGAIDGARFLDSRSAFVVHTPAVIYVWLGQSCEASMAAAAATSALQLVRYERAEGPIITVDEGSEPAAFWVALNDEPPSQNPDELVGKRRVDLYDLDCNMFLSAAVKARMAMPWAFCEMITPVKESGWTRLRREIVSRGWKNILKKSVMERRSLDDEDLRVSEPIRSPGSFSESTTPSSPSADTSSVVYTFSPNSSSSSDWCNLSPPRLKLHRARQTDLSTGFQSLNTGNVEEKNWRSLAERRGGNAPLVLVPTSGDIDQGLSSKDIVRDWCPSPPFISQLEEEQKTINLEQQFSPGNSDEDDTEEDATSFADGANQLSHPVLFRWPNMEILEHVHPEELDSESIFLLLALESKLGSRREKMRKIYVWLGRYCGNDIHGGEEEDENTSLDRIGADSFELMGVPLDTPVQIIREGQEPEQFLNHLFSFH